MESGWRGGVAKLGGVAGDVDAGSAAGGGPGAGLTGGLVLVFFI